MLPVKVKLATKYAISDTEKVAVVMRNMLKTKTPQFKKNSESVMWTSRSPGDRGGMN